MQKQTCFVYLIPGFFGFSNLGGITYFHHVRQYLIEELSKHGYEPTVIEVDTLPTASIRKRATRLFETARESADESSPLFLIGHSTGGLDARLFLTPNSSIHADPKLLEGLARRVKAVVTVATPHFGTPIATFFSSVLGSYFLYLISLATVYTMNSGKLPLKAMLWLGKLVTKADDVLGFENSILDQFYKGLFSDFDADKQEKIRDFMLEVKKDRSLLGQLTPGSLDLLNAGTEDRASVRYGSVVMEARRPGWKTMRSIGLDPYRQASHTVYRILHKLVGDQDISYPDVLSEHKKVFEDAYGKVPDGLESDGVVPTRSQIWGTPIHAGLGDHLDVCGHFNDFDRVPPHYDWIATGSNFKYSDFCSLWSSVCYFLVQHPS